MNAIPCFPEGQIEALTRVLGECGSGTDITRILNDRGLSDDSENPPNGAASTTFF